MSPGFWSGVLGNHSAPAWAVTVLSCSMAAGRYTSPDTVITFFLRFSINHLASLAVVVVLPAPCKPAINTTAGGWAARFRSLVPCPMVAASSRLMMPTRAWPGVNEPTTSWPRVRSFTRAVKSRTTGRATSASNKAMRTSRNMSATLPSVMRAWPRTSLTRRESFSVRAEAMLHSVAPGARNWPWPRWVAAGTHPPRSLNCRDDFSRQRLVRCPHPGGSVGLRPVVRHAPTAGAGAYQRVAGGGVAAAQLGAAAGQHPKPAPLWLWPSPVG